MVTLAGVAQSVLPSDRHCWNVLSWTYSGIVLSSYPAGKLPIVEVILEYDAGNFRNRSDDKHAKADDFWHHRRRLSQNSLIACEHRINN